MLEISAGPSSPPAPTPPHSPSTAPLLSALPAPCPRAASPCPLQLQSSLLPHPPQSETEMCKHLFRYIASIDLIVDKGINLGTSQSKRTPKNVHGSRLPHFHFLLADYPNKYHALSCALRTPLSTPVLHRPPLLFLPFFSFIVAAAAAINSSSSIGANSAVAACSSWLAVVAASCSFSLSLQLMLLLLRSTSPLQLVLLLLPVPRDVD